MTVPSPGDDSRSTAERMTAGDLHVADDPEVFEAGDASLDVLSACDATTARQEPLRRQSLAQLPGASGGGSVIRPPLHLDHGSDIRIGARCFADFGLVALDVAATTTGDDVRLGGGAIVLPGVSTGENTVVGAGAVVTRDLPADVVAVGGPARVVRSVEHPAPRGGALAAEDL